MIGPCAICAAPKATELARSSVALKVSARTASHRRCSPLTSLSSVHGGGRSLPRGRKRRKRNFLTSRSKKRSCSRHIIDFCRVTGVGIRYNRGVATNPLQLVRRFRESPVVSRHRSYGVSRFLFSGSFRECNSQPPLCRTRCHAGGIKLFVVRRLRNGLSVRNGFWRGTCCKRREWSTMGSAMVAEIHSRPLGRPGHVYRVSC